MFAPLSDPAFFAQVRVDPESGTIAWPNGVDFAPEPLYAEASVASPAMVSAACNSPVQRPPIPASRGGSRAGAGNPGARERD